MKVLLTTLNAKYIHTCPALFMLHAYCGERKDVEIQEFTINQSFNIILMEIMRINADIICFACYIWNIEMTLRLADAIKKIAPASIIVFGGPEVSYEFKSIMQMNPAVDIVITGEGEKPFYDMLKCFDEKGVSLKSIEGIPGIAWQNDTSQMDREVHFCKVSHQPPFSDIPFIYNDDNINYFKNRIIYYETARGCPFSCTYCLSGESAAPRSLDITRIKNELIFFLRHQVTQVKLIDRTFNYDKARTYEIWKFLIENDNGITNFHFEIEAQLLTVEEINILKIARRGFFQFECGIQSTNSQTLSAVGRKSVYEQIAKNISAIRRYDNIHIHLDLIAALPYESYSQFEKSFNDTYVLRPHNLQLGFLKLLKGTKIRSDAEKYNIEYSKTAPYEALQTADISFSDMARLKMVELVLDLYYNSYRGFHTLSFLGTFFMSSFKLFESLADYWVERGYHKVSLSKLRLYEILFEFCTLHLSQIQLSYAAQFIKWDMCLDDNVKNFPSFLKFENSEEYRKKTKEMAIANHSYNKKATAVHIFTFCGNEIKVFLFDYNSMRDPITHHAYYRRISI